jgi:tetratricopeptide (TPR) repeat protein
MCCCIFLSQASSVQVTAAAENAAPPREISIVNGDVVEVTLPRWMRLWEDARAAFKAEDYPSALQLYGKLYQIKPGVEEAAWEYCKLLIGSGDFGVLKSVLDGLLEQAPNRNEYLLMAGKVALHNREYDLAARRFGKVFENDPVGEHAVVALEGLVDSLRAQGKKRLAFPLLEQLSLRKPGDREILSELARDAYLLEMNRKAHRLYGVLVQEPEVADRILFKAAQVYEAVSDTGGAVELWLRYLKRHPDYFPFREKLVQHYLSRNRFEEAVSHLEKLAAGIDRDGRDLLELSDIYLYRLHRPDKALYYYEKYLDIHPEDEKIRKKISDIQSYLANDFLAIVENDGARMLWRDLAAIAPNRLAIYLEMARILEQKGKTRELVEILVILFTASPEDDTVILRLARSYIKLQEYEKALVYLKKLSDGARNKEVELLMADTLHSLGRSEQELEKRLEALRHDPRDVKLLNDCLVLSGEIGFVEKQIEIFAYVMRQEQHYTPLFELVRTHLHYLAGNYMVEESQKVYQWAKARFHSSPEIQAGLTMLWADSLNRAGLKKKADGVLRNLLHEGYLKEQIGVQLATISLEDGRLEEADSWLRTVMDGIGSVQGAAADALNCDLLLTRVKALAGNGLHQDAMNLLQEMAAGAGIQKGAESTGQCSRYRLDLEIGRQLADRGDYSRAFDTIRKYTAAQAPDPALSVLRHKILRNLPSSGPGDGDSFALKDSEPDSDVRNLSRVSEQALEYQEFELADEYTGRLLESYPSSVLGMYLRADCFSAMGRFPEAAAVYAELIKRFPREPYPVKSLLAVQMRMGEYAGALETLTGGRHDPGNLQLYIDQRMQENDIDNLVLLARILWGSKMNAQALEVYERLLSPSMAEIMNDRFTEKQIDFQFLAGADNFWNSLQYLLQSEPKVIAELMQPSFLLDHLDTDTGRIVSDNFERYCWHRLIQSEYLARNATYKRKYLYAEQSYKRLLKEQESTQGMLDLASIYERIGEYRKEAKMYEAIKSSGGDSPDLEESMARASVEISPRTGIDGIYLEKSGREGFMDLLMTGYGVSFKMTPNLNMDMRFQYEMRDYDSFNFDSGISSNVLKGQALIELGEDYELDVETGIEKFEDNSSTRLQYSLVLTGQLDDYLKAYLSVKKNPVTDTIIAVKEQVYYQGVGIGFNYDTPIGLSFGGDFLNLHFDGDNTQQKYHWLTSYGIYGDSSELVLRYDYNYINSEEENSSPLSENVELMEDSLYYWSPDFFSEHALSVWFKHYFLGYREESRLIKSYYSLNSGFGSEDNGHLSYKGGFDLFFEMGPRFMVNSNFTLVRSEEYEEARLSLSVDYRW